MRCTYRQLAKAISKLGFVPARTKGSHIIFRHPDGRCTVVPHHSGRDIGDGLLNKILKSELKIDRKKLMKLLKK